MNLSEYFEKTQGTGILATSDDQGNVDLAVYAKPHIIDESTIAFIMTSHLSYQNISKNPNAAYMFLEKGPGYKGQRIYLKKIRQEKDPEKVNAMRRVAKPTTDGESSQIVFFHIEKTRPIID